MSKLTVTNIKRPILNKKDMPNEVKQEEIQKTHYDKQKEKQTELMQKANKKTAEYQSSKPSSGVFTEVTTSGAFTSKNAPVKEAVKSDSRASSPRNGNGSNGAKSLLGFPSSANDLALDAKSDLEADANISKETKEKVIEKLFTLVSMVQHVFESKVRIMAELDKFKDTHLKNEIRREKEHSEQLYKLNMNFQNEVVQAIQRLKSEIDISRNVSQNVEEKINHKTSNEDSSSFEFNIVGEQVKNKIGDDVIEDQCESEVKSDDPQ